MRNRHRVLVCGHTGRGNYGHGLDTVWQHVPSCEIVGVVDPDEAGRVAGLRRLEVASGYASLEEGLAAEQPDIVAICPRWIDAHRDWVLAVAATGAHIYMEKPFCRSAAEADEIIAACEASGTKLALAHQTRYSPVTSAVKRLLEEGAIGELLEIRARGKEDHRGGGEDLWVLGSHLMNLIHHLAGEPEWVQAQCEVEGRAVMATDIREGNEGLGPLAGDTVRAMYGLPNGATAFFGSRRGAAGNRFGLQLFGSTGVIELLTGYLPAASILRDPSWSPARSGKAWETITSAGIGMPEEVRDEGGHGGNLAAVHDLLAAIADDRHPECSMYEGRVTVEMICGVFASHRSGQRESLPLREREHAWATWS